MIIWSDNERRPGWRSMFEREFGAEALAEYDDARAYLAGLDAGRLPIEIILARALRRLDALEAANGQG